MSKEKQDLIELARTIRDSLTEEANKCALSLDDKAIGLKEASIMMEDVVMILDYISYPESIPHDMEV